MERPTLGMGGTTQMACILDEIKGEGRLAASHLLCHGLFLLCDTRLPCCPALEAANYGLKTLQIMAQNRPYLLSLVDVTYFVSAMKKSNQDSMIRYLSGELLGKWEFSTQL